MFTAPIQKLIYWKTCILYFKYHKYLDAANSVNCISLTKLAKNYVPNSSSRVLSSAVLLIGSIS